MSILQLVVEPTPAEEWVRRAVEELVHRVVEAPTPSGPQSDVGMRTGGPVDPRGRRGSLDLTGVTRLRV